MPKRRQGLEGDARLKPHSYPYIIPRVALITRDTNFPEKGLKWYSGEFDFVKNTMGDMTHIAVQWENCCRKYGYRHTISDFYVECLTMYPNMTDTDLTFWTQNEVDIFARHRTRNMHAIFEDLLRFGSRKSWREVGRKYHKISRHGYDSELTLENAVEILELMHDYNGDYSKVVEITNLDEDLIREWYEPLSEAQRRPLPLAQVKQAVNGNTIKRNPGLYKTSVRDFMENDVTRLDGQADINLLKAARKVGTDDFYHEEFQKNTPRRIDGHDKQERYLHLKSQGYLRNHKNNNKDSQNSNVGVRDASVPWTVAEHTSLFGLLSLYATNGEENVDWDTIAYYVSTRSPEVCQDRYRSLVSGWSQY